MFKRLIFFLLLSVSITGLLAQRKCYTNLDEGQGSAIKKRTLQEWIGRTAKENRNSRVESTEELVYTIPVVFHIIYNNDEENIPDEQVLSQVRILNEDFRRANPDTVSTPLKFRDIAADTRIEFKLAERDPDGNPTSGIVRIPASRASYDIESFEGRRQMALASHWNESQYLNIKVANLSEQQLGYANFPDTNLPGGNTGTSDSGVLDCVFIDYKFLGDQDEASSSSEGRTGTHELGHYFGLLHTFEAFSCNVDGDFCADTPKMNSSTPFGLRRCSDNLTDNFCDEDTIMIGNYLDYSPDRCMNLFTKCQKSRMRTVIENSTNRFSLLSSPAINIDNDLAIVKILSPLNEECNEQHNPSILVRNVGSNDILNYSVGLYLDDELIEVKSIDEPLKKGISVQTLNFEPVTLTGSRNTTFSFRILSVNDTTDLEISNNTMEINTCKVIEPLFLDEVIVKNGKLTINSFIGNRDFLVIKIVNMEGNIVTEQTIENIGGEQIDISTTSLSNGLYILTIEGNQYKRREKFFVFQ